jgi:hypothetical protein
MNPARSSVTNQERADVKVFLHVGFGRRPAVQTCVAATPLRWPVLALRAEVFMDAVAIQVDYSVKATLIRGSS